MKPSTSLSTFMLNAFYDLSIQDDDHIFRLTYEKNWSRHVKITNNGKPLDYDEFFEFLTGLRKSITDRQLLSSTCVVAPADPDGITGQIARTSRFSGQQDGKLVSGTIVSVLKVGKHEGRRMVEKEDFVFAMDGQDDEQAKSDEKPHKKRRSRAGA